MFDTVLIPTDGTKLSVKAATYGLQLAKKLGAKAIAVTVTTPAESIMVGEVQVVRNREEYETKAAAEAKAILDVITKLANETGVTCAALHVRDALPWHAILATAKSQSADVIVMASHGRRGLSAMLIGSETQKVVSHSQIPVLIYR